MGAMSRDVCDEILSTLRDVDKTVSTDLKGNLRGQGERVEQFKSKTWREIPNAVQKYLRESLFL